MTDQKTRTENDAVIEAVRGLHGFQQINIDPPASENSIAPVLLVPKDMQTFNLRSVLDEYRTRPRRRTQAAKLIDVKSFSDHVKRYAAGVEKGVTLYATIDPAQITATYDDHTTDQLPGFAQDTASYSFPISKAWKAWIENALSGASLTEFASFLEDNLADVVDPSTAGDGAQKFATRFSVEYASADRILQLSRGLALKERSEVQHSVNLGSGEGEVSWKVSHEDKEGGKLNVPGAVLIAIQVFDGGPMYQIPIRIRYRVKDGQLRWWLLAHRSDLAREKAIRDVCNQIATDTGAPLFYGRR